MYKIINNDSLLALEELEENSIDSIVTDPPYELNFMGKGWDNAGISFNKEIWQKCLRVLKPGGYLLAFGGSRTFHRIAVAIEDAGFEIRDTIMWLYGSGFPKSMNIGKAIEGKLTIGSANVRDIKKLDGIKTSVTCGFNKTGKETGYRDKEYEMVKTDVIYHTEEGKNWQGWGTALKPSFEPIIVARKPFKGSLVDNVIEYGVGGINIDECRVESNESIETGRNGRNDKSTFQASETNKEKQEYQNKGRFPANTILTYNDTDFEEVCGGFPNTKSNGGKTTMPDLRDVGKKSKKAIGIDKLSFGQVSNVDRKESTYIAPCDSGSASRYFYCAKASKKDRDDGLEEFETKSHEEINNRKEGSAGATRQYGGGTNLFLSVSCPRKNTHPTVKPTELMQYLVRLVTPKGGTILDPFMGSGSTGKAVMFENKERNADYSFIGIEREKEYCNIAEARISFASKYEISKEEKNQISFADLLDG